MYLLEKNEYQFMRGDVTSRSFFKFSLKDENQFCKDYVNILEKDEYPFMRDDVASRWPSLELEIFSRKMIIKFLKLV